MAGSVIDHAHVWMGYLARPRELLARSYDGIWELISNGTLVYIPGLSKTIHIGPREVALGLAVGIPALSVTRYLVYFVTGYIKYRMQASKTGLPMVSVPYLETNIFFSNLVRTNTYKRLFGMLPSWSKRWARWVRPEWRWIAKYSIHADMGDIFQVVTPEQINVNIADADVLMDVLNRRTEFTKYQPINGIVAVFGENVLTVEHHDWTRHRKVIGPSFSESTNAIVWNETIRQASAMLRYWRNTPPSDHKLLLHSLKLVGLNVMSYVEFGIPLPFDHEKDVTVIAEVSTRNAARKGKSVATKYTFREAFGLITNDFRKMIGALIAPKWLLPLLGNEFGQMLDAKAAIDSYIHAILKREESAPGQNVSESGKETLISALVKANAEAMAEEATGSPRAGLSNSEILGNVYVMILAALDTTSTALQFALINLAIHQDKQAWLHEQLDKDLASAEVPLSADPATWEYDTLFRKLTGPMCVAYETLRTHPSIPATLRWTGSEPRTITWHEDPLKSPRHIVLPAQSVVVLNFVGVQYNPKYWGLDAAEYKPERWAMESYTHEEQKDQGIQPSAKFPGVRRPPRGAFLPWSEGFRACLGRRFAETQMAAVLAVLFSQYRCEIRQQPGETSEGAKRRAQRALDGATMQMSLAARDRIELVWVPRK